MTNKKYKAVLPKSVTHFVDITGNRFGSLLAIRPEPMPKDRPVGLRFRGLHWECSCDCGRVIVASGWKLRTERVKHCGCVGSQGGYRLRPLMADDHYEGMRFGSCIIKARLYKNTGNLELDHYEFECGCGRVSSQRLPTIKKNGKCRLCHGRPGDKIKRKQRIRNIHGYILFYAPDHPGSDKRGRILEHRYVVSKHIGRALTAREVIHHKNGKRDDNRIENLEIWEITHPSGRKAGSTKTRKSISVQTVNNLIQPDLFGEFK